MECVLFQVVGIFKENNIIIVPKLRETTVENTLVSYYTEITEFCLLSLKSVKELPLN